jgi:hypothetical protein
MNQQVQPNTTTPVAAVTPDAIMQLGFAFWGSKTLLSAIELGLFTLLADGPMSAEALTTQLKLHPRSVRDFLDALVALGQLERATTRSIPIRRRARCFSIAASRPMWAAYSKWQTRGSIHSGAR